MAIGIPAPLRLPARLSKTVQLTQLLRRSCRPGPSPTSSRPPTNPWRRYIAAPCPFRQQRNDAYEAPLAFLIPPGLHGLYPVYVTCHNLVGRLAIVLG